MRNEGKYYDWSKTFSYDAPVNVVVSMRGYGKTYGIRKTAIKDFVKDGSRFVEVVRYKTQLKGENAVQKGYFEKIIKKNEFPDLMFRVTGTNAYVAKKPKNEKDKPKWEQIGYFVALTEMQQSKQRTFVNVKKVIFDEFIIDKRTQSRYLSGEYSLFSNLIDSLAREEVDENGNPMGTPVKAFLLGNACDLTNPYFVAWGISDRPKEGYSWHFGKTVLLHYAHDESYKEGKRKTLVGRLVHGTEEEKIIIDNDFKIGDSYNIAKKSPTAVYQIGLVYRGLEYGIWLDASKGYVYVCKGIVEGSGANTLCLSREDDTVNTIMARKGEKTLKTLVDMYYADVLRFETQGIRDSFMQTLDSFGIR